MRLAASDSALEFIETHGGRLYIWIKQSRCCGGLHTIGTATEAPPKITFRQLDNACTRLAPFVPEPHGRMPDALHVELLTFPPRVQPYWNGGPWVASTAHV